MTATSAPMSEPAGDRQIAAADVKDKGGELGQEVVQELDEEFALKDLVADLVDAPEARRRYRHARSCWYRVP